MKQRRAERSFNGHDVGMYHATQLRGYLTSQEKKKKNQNIDQIYNLPFKICL